MLAHAVRYCVVFPGVGIGVNAYMRGLQLYLWKSKNITTLGFVSWELLCRYSVALPYQNYSASLHVLSFLRVEA